VKKKLLLVFLIIIFIPITVITVMAVYTYRNREKQNFELQKNEAEKILVINDRLLQNRIRLIENELDLIPLDSSIPIAVLRENMNRERMIKQAFIIDESDLFSYPFHGGDLSQREREFINESLNIELVENLRSRISPEENRKAQSQWYTWFMGDGLNFIYFTLEKEIITGFLIERYALISQLINVLPQSRETDDMFKIQLTDARGNVLYQWGNFIPDETVKPLVEYSLSGTLSSWRLFYFHNEFLNDDQPGNLQTILILTGLTLITIVIFLLALYFYRESAKEMETARKQVSFVNQVSHELKTPLTNIRLYSELLQNRLKTGKELNYIEVIVNESNRLGRMINNVLTFSRGERGELNKKTETVNINSLIREILDKFNPLLVEKSIKSEYREIKLPSVETDRDMIEQILINLIGNAIKYGASGKFLGISADVQNKYLVIYIKDRGPGIGDSEKNKIFKPFYRIDSSLTQKNSGTGIGLSIAKTLAKETGAFLQLEKSSDGACFSLSIPIGENSL